MPSTRSTPRFTLGAVLLLAGCTDHAPAPVPLESACPLTDTVRIADLPPDWPPADSPYAHTWLNPVADKLLVRWEVFGLAAPEWDLFLVDPCGPTTDVLAPAELDITWIHTRDTPEGQVAYAVSDVDDTLYRLDRLDIPGTDGSELVFTFHGPTSMFSLGDTLVFAVGGDDNFWWNAAGIGLEPTELWRLGPGDEVPTPFVTDVNAYRSAHSDDGPRPLFVLTDDGTLSLYPQVQGPAEVLQTGVRYFEITPNGRYLIWQELGDGLAEPVHLRDLENSTDIVLTVNDFLAQSFGKGEGMQDYLDTVGTWVATDDSSAIALLGPDTTILRAFVTATGEPVDVPEHIAFAGAPWGVYRDNFVLTLPDPSQNVTALWLPSTGDQIVAYRGPDEIHFIDRGHGGIEYRRNALRLDGSWDPNYSLWSLDRDTGASTLVLPRYSGSLHTLDDGRLVYGVADDNGDDTLTVYDPDTGVFKTFGALASDWLFVPGLGVAYVDLRSASPGLYLAPIPPK